LPDPGVELRCAREADARAIWEWRNEPAARAASFSSEAIPYESHEHWFRARLAEPATRFLIAVDPDGAEIGYVRFALSGEEAEIGVGLAPSARGRGYGRRVISGACDELLATSPVRRVLARVKSANEASLHAFRAAGFVERGRDDEAVELVLAA
jgi:RimJ/RimL family protein N-acetyltransferase